MHVKSCDFDQIISGYLTSLQNWRKVIFSNQCLYTCIVFALTSTEKLDRGNLFQNKESSYNTVQGYSNSTSLYNPDKCSVAQTNVFDTIVDPARPETRDTKILLL